MLKRKSVEKRWPEKKVEEQRNVGPSKEKTAEMAETNETLTQSPGNNSAVAASQPKVGFFRGVLGVFGKKTQAPPASAETTAVTSGTDDSVVEGEEPSDPPPSSQQQSHFVGPYSHANPASLLSWQGVKKRISSSHSSTKLTPAEIQAFQISLKLEEGDIATLQQQFQRLASDSGVLDLDDFSQVLGLLGIHRPLSKKIFAGFDLTKSGVLDVRAFITGVANLTASTHFQKTRMAFCVWDGEGDHKISREKVIDLLESTKDMLNSLYPGLTPRYSFLVNLLHFFWRKSVSQDFHVFQLADNLWREIGRVGAQQATFEDFATAKFVPPGVLTDITSPLPIQKVFRSSFFAVRDIF